MTPTPVRISAVSYLNTRPFIYGLEQRPVPGITITRDIPSECARKLLAGETDIGLVPVAIIPQLPGAQIISQYCIGAVGPVRSVKLYARSPLHEIKRIWLDFHSRTSVNLARILAREKWNISPEWLPAAAGFESTISGTDAAVVIGDRTFAMNGHFETEIDLAGDWMIHTGLPFVFAAWVTRNHYPEEFTAPFNAALGYGLEHIPQCLTGDSDGIPKAEALDYLQNAISYTLDDSKKEGLKTFLGKLAAYGLK